MDGVCAGRRFRTGVTATAVGVSPGVTTCNGRTEVSTEAVGGVLRKGAFACCGDGSRVAMMAATAARAFRNGECVCAGADGERAGVVVGGIVGRWLEHEGGFGRA